MKLADWLRYLHSLPSGLARRSLVDVKRIATKLGILDFPGKIVTVAGTNGKGSTVIFLEAILLAANVRVGSYISPHVLEYTERIRLGGKNVQQDMLCSALSLVAEVCGDTVLSYFEFTTLAAGVIFKQHQLDILLLEVGLGGRYDAVNIFASDITVITTIALDHTHILGATRAAIGYAKSGIIRPLQPVVCGDNLPSVVYTTARHLQAKPYVLHKDFSYVEELGAWRWWYQEEQLNSLPLPQLPIANAALALMVVRLLVHKNFKHMYSAICCGLHKAFLLGRFQRLIFRGKEIIFDVAHNSEATTLLAERLVRIKKTGGRILAVVSMLQDKDIAASLMPLVTIIDFLYIGQLFVERAANVECIAQYLLQLGEKNTKFPLFSTVRAALQQAIAECREKDKILVVGSFHTVAESLCYCMSCEGN